MIVMIDTGATIRVGLYSGGLVFGGLRYIASTSG